MANLRELRRLLGVRSPSDIIKADARKHGLIFFGGRALNKQMSFGFLERVTHDFDLLTGNSKPRRHARRVLKKVEKLRPKKQWYLKKALHEGTVKLMNIGADRRRGTQDDYGLADFSGGTRPYVNIKGLKYETLSHIKQDKRRILKDKESRYRHEKDRGDIRRIEASRRLKRTKRW